MCVLMCGVWGGGESKGFRFNDLHSHPRSILNFKFIIRNTLPERQRGSRRERDVD